MPKTTLFDPTTFTEGGSGFSLAGIEGVVVGSMFKYTNFAKKDGTIPTYKKGPNAGQPVDPATQWEILVKTDDLDDPIRATISCGKILLPSKDAVLAAKDLEGPYLMHPEGKPTTFNKQSGGGIFVESLANCSFDTDLLNEDGAPALIGYRLKFDEIQRKDKKGEDMGGPTTVCTKIVHGPGTSAKAGAKKAAAAPAAVVKGKKAAPVAAPVEEDETEVDAETLVTEVISEILAETSPLPKAKVSMMVNKKLAEMGLENSDRLAALKLATSDDFLAAGPWSFDKKSLSAL
jgi:hypothetical protein